MKKNNEWEKIADDETLNKTTESLKQRGINVIIVENKEDALNKIKELIPGRGEVMNGSSITLKEIGFVDYLKSGEHKWNNLHEAILKEQDKEKQVELRKKSILADYFLGSVHAVTETGEVVIASASGSQISSYAFSSDNVIWVVGTQKIVSTVEEAFQRIKEYVYPLENERMKKEGYPGSTIGQILIFERNIMPNRKITLIFVKEKLGF